MQQFNFVAMLSEDCTVQRKAALDFELKAMQANLKFPMK
jgi:hypothetical protein